MTGLTDYQFLDLTTEPTYNSSKHGWYNGNDRCIGALYHDGTNLIVQSKKGNIHAYGGYLLEVDTTNLDSIITFASVPPNGCAIGVFGRFNDTHSTSTLLPVKIFATDGTNDIGYAISHTGAPSVPPLRQ